MLPTHLFEFDAFHLWCRYNCVWWEGSRKHNEDSFIWDGHPIATVLFLRCFNLPVTAEDTHREAFSFSGEKSAYCERRKSYQYSQKETTIDWIPNQNAPTLFPFISGTAPVREVSLRLRWIRPQNFNTACHPSIKEFPQISILSNAFGQSRFPLLYCMLDRDQMGGEGLSTAADPESFL